MDETYQNATQRVSSTSKGTRGLVVAYHFLITAALTAALVVVWVESRSSQEQILTPQLVSAVLAPFALLYLITGLGILGWRNWSRILSLVLNWSNVLGAVVSIARLRVNAEGVLSLLLSCLVLWWLSVPAVKLAFQGGSRTQ
jgi:chromate transport protein ChrA